eukprot:TRINITY_DN33870_c0_g1_i3.p1 TRINITY_DN33870_c0_g1~~TRINITY_DN33870_c0_g1_i3.p1  ORF type:complete len:1104 (+),score=294.25 TRINITY_DN33870_c0_g1_i3:87-3314(+)
MADAAAPDAATAADAAQPEAGGTGAAADVQKSASTTAGGPKKDTGGSECISVVARVRPDKNPSECVTLQSKRVLVTLPKTGDFNVNNQIEEYKFDFNRTFGPDASQEDVFNAVARDLVLGALDGVNCTIFAYGQTGSGKTFTMCGGKGSYHDRGIIPRTLGCIFDNIERRRDGVEYSVSMSFIEIYKEVGYDLLAKDFGADIKSWPAVSVSFMGSEPVLSGAKKVKLESEDNGLDQYFLGDTRRTVAETPHNLNSSRSHCLFTIFIEARDQEAQSVRTSKVQIVDLAGSERLKPYEQGSQNTKELMGQAVAINLSLHWLESVINALNQGSKIVPYRNSFLTKVLKDALGGNAKAVMVCTINPSEPALPETLSSCRFAQRVANVKTNARVNEEQDPHLVIAALRTEVSDLKACLKAAEGGEAADELSMEEVRKRVKAYLEDRRSDTGGDDGDTGGSSLQIPGVRDAYTAFRVFRELHWELLRGKHDVAPAEERRPSSSPDRVAKTSDVVADADAAAPDENSKELLASSKRELEDCQRECRMLRAALTAAQQKPAPKPAARPPPPKAQTVSTGTQYSKEDIPKPKASKPKRPTSADGRPKGMRGFVGFSAEDVVDRFGGGGGGGQSSSASLDKPRDSRVPDFRTASQTVGASTLASSGEGVAGLPPRPQSSQDSPMRPEPDAVGAKPRGDSALDAQLSRLAAASDQCTETAAAPAQAAQEGGGYSSAWLNATTALVKEELAFFGDPKQVYQLFLQHDPRAADIWPSDLQDLRQQRRERMEEARQLGEEIGRTKEATSKVQEALEALKAKLRAAEAEAAIDPSASERAEKLRALLAGEEPKLLQLFEEKRQRYELDFSRLKELRREISHLEHGEKKLEASVQSEFQKWREAVERRYPDAVKAAKENPPPTSMQVDHDASPSTGVAVDPRAAPQVDVSSTPKSQASPMNLSAAEAALASLRQRLEEARQAGEAGRVQMLEKLLAAEEPRLSKLRLEQPQPQLSAPQASTFVTPPAAVAATKPDSPKPQALVTAEAALAALRERLEQAKLAQDEKRVAMLSQLLANEEPRIAQLRAELQA